MWNSASRNRTPRVTRIAAPVNPRARHLGQSQALFGMYALISRLRLSLQHQTLVTDPQANADQKQRPEPADFKVPHATDQEENAQSDQNNRAHRLIARR